MFQTDGQWNAKLRCPVDVLTLGNWTHRVHAAAVVAFIGSGVQTCQLSLTHSAWDSLVNTFEFNLIPHATQHNTTQVSVPLCNAPAQQHKFNCQKYATQCAATQSTAPYVCITLSLLRESNDDVQPCSDCWCISWAQNASSKITALPQTIGAGRD